MKQGRKYDRVTSMTGAQVWQGQRYNRVEGMKGS